MNSLQTSILNKADKSIWRSKKWLAGFSGSIFVTITWFGTLMFISKHPELVDKLVSFSMVVVSLLGSISMALIGGQALQDTKILAAATAPVSAPAETESE